jgi:drug/metabolite transporter (DMT)-like permease
VSAAASIDSAEVRAPSVRGENTRLGILLILLSSLTFVVMNAVVKTISDRLSPMEIGFFRQLFSLIIVLAIVARRGGLPVLKTRRPLGHLFRGLIGNSAMIIYLLSIAQLPLADANAISFASPLFITALSAPLLKEVVGKHRWGAVAIGFIGVLVITNPTGHLAGPQAGVGAGLGVLAAFTSALMSITIRQLNKTEHPLTIVFYFAFIGMVFFGAMQPFVWVTPTPAEWLALGAIGLIGAMSQLLMTTAYRHASASSLAPFGYTSILWSAGLGYLIWSDLPGWHVLVGSVIVILSGLYIIYRETRKRAAKATPALADAG